MSVVIIGASGYIGSCLLEKAPLDSWGTASSGRTPGLIDFDLAHSDGFPWHRLFKDDVVVMTAAISSPDICAHEHARAWAVNVTGTSEFITNVIARGGRVIFFSSDAAYGEHSDIFDENTVSHPVGEYAVMKHEVEKRFQGNPSFKSIRLSYVFSKEDKFTQYLNGCASSGEEAELFHPFYRAIVHRDDVIDGALALATRWDEFPQQIINFGGPEVLSRIDFAQCLKNAALPNLRFIVKDPGPDFFNNRPRVIAMSSEVLPKLLARPSHTLAEAVKIEFLSK
ncbi:MAG: NAD(P)-dependent oxidoreductase [Gammaproteobacteria bacterium]|nr:NAD(P)-dependent oxidoreductase [Gammaproteobacteria bacterium]MBQ0839745.1 NAD(P)-dependent oxidoreductase [Gammaproteobacteria bacterium]